MPSFNSIALIGRYNGREGADSLNALGSFLVGLGCRVLVEKDSAGNYLDFKVILTLTQN